MFHLIDVLSASTIQNTPKTYSAVTDIQVAILPSLFDISLQVYIYKTGTHSVAVSGQQPCERWDLETLWACPHFIDSNSFSQANIKMQNLLDEEA